MLIYFYSIQMSSPTYKISTLDNVVLNSPKVADNKIVNSSNAQITLPSVESTLATVATTDALSTRIDGITTNLANYATLAGEETLTNKTLTTPAISSIVNGAATITVPSTTGTMALMSDVGAVSSNLTTLQARFGRLLDYLEAWINVGNLSMADIKSSVDPSS